MGDTDQTSATRIDSNSSNVVSSQLNPLSTTSSSMAGQRTRKPRMPRSLSQMSEEYADDPVDDDPTTNAVSTVIDPEEDDDEDEDEDEPLDEGDEDEEIEEDCDDDADRAEDVVSSALDAKLLQQLESSGAGEHFRQLLNTSTDNRSELINVLMNSGAEAAGLDASTLASLTAALTNAVNSSSAPTSLHSPDSNGSHMSSRSSPQTRSTSTGRKRKSNLQQCTTTSSSIGVGSGSSTDLSMPIDSLDLTSGSGGPNGRSKVFECKVCHHRFGYKHVLQNHERIHTGTSSVSVLF